MQSESEVQLRRVEYPEVEVEVVGRGWKSSRLF
jgi:hypothetical protein